MTQVAEALARLAAALGEDPEDSALPPSAADAFEAKAIADLLARASPARVGLAAWELYEACAASNDKGIVNPATALGALKLAQEMREVVAGQVLRAARGA